MRQFFQSNEHWTLRDCNILLDFYCKLPLVDTVEMVTQAQSGSEIDSAVAADSALTSPSQISAAHRFPCEFPLPRAQIITTNISAQRHVPVTSLHLALSVAHHATPGSGLIGVPCSGPTWYLSRASTAFEERSKGLVVVRGIFLRGRSTATRRSSLTHWTAVRPL